MFAVVRVRGSVNINYDAENTLELLKLKRPNHCVILPENKKIVGMLKRVEMFITWGEINKEMLEKLIYKRGRTDDNKRIEKERAKKIAKDILDEKDVDIKNVFRLKPPSHGYKPVKEFFPKGALGYRKEKINELLKRMI